MYDIIVLTSKIMYDKKKIHIFLINMSLISLILKNMYISLVVSGSAVAQR